jgi:hypothetical protein
MSVEALKPGGKLTKQVLVALGNNPELESFQIVCHWEDGKTTIGWMPEMTHAQLVFGATQLSLEVNDRVFYHHEDEDSPPHQA